MENDLLSALARTITPYTPGEQPQDGKYIKLNTNESPYPPSPKVIKAVQQAAGDSLRLYPDPDGTRLRAAIARRYSLNDEQVFLGNGSDEILAFAFLAFFDQDRPILFPDITYSFYKVYAALFRIPYHLVPLTGSFDIPVDELLKDNGGIIFPNPNAPTGNCLPPSAIRTILEHNRRKAVIIDEAYIDFGGISSAPLIREFPNLLIIQTLSKSRALAGLRVGYALGSGEMIEGLKRIKNSVNSYTLDRLALAGAAAAIEDDAYARELQTRIIATRERTSKALQASGFTVIPSCANFLFISHPEFKAPVLYEKLRENRILVRYFSSPRIDNFLRVTIGTDDEMDSLLTTLAKITRP